jgi:2,3,4,5-tetrahydropyridine-2-carboxylate N-succinyltransferase
MLNIQKIIEDGFDNRTQINPHTSGELREAVNTALAGLDNGSLRVAEKQASGEWVVHQWLKKAVLLSFRLNDNRVMSFAGTS